MSSYSTLRVTRRTAIETVAALLEQKLERLRQGDVSDCELEQELDKILEPQLNYSRIVDDDEPDNDDDRIPT
jgi:hypothetical protein